MEQKRVEEVFVRFSQVLNVHLPGRIICTTGEHPFFVQRTWSFIPANELEVGDQLLSHDGQWIPVEDLFDTGEYQTVYNLRVADFHTYFVGSSEWSFSVWAHNQYTGPNLNINGAKSKFGIYEISVNSALFKIGKADMGRITQSSGLPTRLHQQLRQLSDIFGKENVSHTITSLGIVTTAQAKLAETGRLLQVFDQIGFVLIGNWKSFRPRLS